MILRATAVWVLLAVLAVLNGVVRDLLLARRLAERTAHWVSTAVLCAVILGVSGLTIDWIHPVRAREALSIGSYWVVLTLAFEFLAGRYLFGRSWTTLLADYDMRRGRVWVLVLVVTLLAPLLAARWVGRVG